MKGNQKKAVKAGKKGGQTVIALAIGGVTVTCAAGPMPGTKNVTVTATGVTAPFALPITCSLAGPPTAVLKRNGIQVGSQTMNPDTSVPPIPGKYVTTFSGLQPGAFDAKVTVNWNVLYPDTLSGSANCP